MSEVRGTKDEGKETKGLQVKKGKKEIQVSFEYHPGLVALIARVPGAEYNRDKDYWSVPPDSQEALDKAVATMKKLEDQDRAARIEIESMANASARDLMAGEGVKGIDPKISDYHEKDKAISGEIINVNAHYAAQFTGFGKEDGAAFVTLHRLASLTAPVFKGDDVSIKYDAKGRGQVSPRVPGLAETMGKEVFGVKVVEKDGLYQVSFGFNPAMAQRLQRVAGAEFNDETKAYDIPVEMKEFVARAVSDMRRIYLVDQEAEHDLTRLAEQKMDGAKVVKPLRSGQNSHGYTGPAVGENDIFVLQHTGKEYFTLHRKADLDRVPKIGENARIQYQEGRGKVLDKAQSRNLAHSH